MTRVQCVIISLIAMVVTAATAVAQVASSDELGSYELGRLPLDGKPLADKSLRSIAAMRFSADGKFVNAIGWHDFLDKHLSTQAWDVTRKTVTQGQVMKSFSTPVKRLKQVNLARNPATSANDFFAARTRRELVFRGGTKSAPRIDKLPESGVYRDITFAPNGKLLSAYQASEKSEVMVKQHDLARSNGDKAVITVPVSRDLEVRRIPFSVLYRTHAFSIAQHPSKPILATANVRYEHSSQPKRTGRRPSRDEVARIRVVSKAIKIDEAPATVLQLWDSSTGKLLSSIPDVGYTTFLYTTMVHYSEYGLDRPIAADDYYCPVRFSPDGRTLLAGLSLIDVDSSSVRARLARNDLIFDAVFAPDGSWLATIGHAMRLPAFGQTKATSRSSATHVLRFWSTISGELLADIDLGGEAVIVSGNDDIDPSLARSPDGNLIATTLGESEATIRLWNTKRILADKPRVPRLDPAPEYPIRHADQYFDFARDAEEALQKREYAAAIQGFEKAIKNMESRGESFLHNAVLFQAYERRALALGLMGKQAAADAELVRLMGAPTTGFGTKLKLRRETQLGVLQRSLDRDPRNPTLFDLLRDVVRRFKRIETGTILDSGKQEYEALVDERIEKASAQLRSIKEDKSLAQAYSNRAFLHTMKDDFPAATEDVDRALQLDPDNAALSEEKRRIAIGQHMATTPDQPIPKSLRLEPSPSLLGTTWRMENGGRTWTFLDGGKLQDSTWRSYMDGRWTLEKNQLTVTRTIPGGDRPDDVRTYKLLVEGDVLRFAKLPSYGAGDYWIRDAAVPELQFNRIVAFRAYTLGTAWTQAVFANQLHGDGERLTRVWKLAQGLAEKLNVELPGLPKLSGSKNRDVRTTLMHLFTKSKPLTEKLATEHGSVEAYYFDLAVKTQLVPIIVKVRQTSLLQSIANVIKRAESDGGLPAEVWSPMVDKLESDVTLSEIQEPYQQFIKDTLAFLKKENSQK